MDTHDYVTEYAAKIQSGEILAPASVVSIFSMLATEIAEDKGRWRFDPALGNRPREFSRRFIRHSKGKFNNQPFIYELWQSAATQALYGFIDRNTGVRRFTECALLVPRKAGKSTWAASLAIFEAIGDNEPSAEIYVLASTFAQADEVIFAQIRSCVNKNPMLRKRFHKRKSDLYDSKTDSKIQPLAAGRPDALDGKNASMAILDEAFAITDETLWATMRQSMATRTQPLMLVVSSAGKAEGNLYVTMRNLGLKVANGDLPLDRYLPLVFEADPEKWEDEEEWHRANPSLGTVKSIDDMRQKHQRSKEVKSDEVSFKSKDLGILAVNSAISWLDYQELQLATTEEWSIEDFRGCVGVAGVDLSLCGDLTSACVLFYKNGKWYFHHHHWLPRNLLEEHVKRDKIPYEQWISDGHVSLSDGNGGNAISTDDVYDWFLHLIQDCGISISYVGYDPWGSRSFVDKMTSSFGNVMVEVRQGSRTLSEPFQRLTADWRAGNIQISDPTTLWCCSNVVLEEEKRNQTWLPRKARGRQRTDAFSSMLCAYVVATTNLEEVKRFS